MAEAVKRYDLVIDGSYVSGESVMTHVGNGDWVRADDYDAVAEENARLKAIISEVSDSVRDALSSLNDF